MDKLVTTANGGMPMTLDDLRYFLGQGSYDAGLYQALQGILLNYGTDFIVSGCAISGGGPTYNVAAGWIMLAGELLKVDAHSFNSGTAQYYAKATSYNADGDKSFQDGSIVQTYQKNRGTVSAGGSGTLKYDTPAWRPVTGNYQIIALAANTITFVQKSGMIWCDFAGGTLKTITHAAVTDCQLIGIRNTGTAGTIDNTGNIYPGLGITSITIAPVQIIYFFYNPALSKWAVIDSTALRQATQAEVEARTEERAVITPANVQYDVGQQVLRKIVEIGDWNMYATGGGTGSLTNHIYFSSFGFANAHNGDKIRAIEVTILNNSGAPYNLRSLYNAGTSAYEICGDWAVGNVTEWGISMRCVSGGYFDSADFNAEPFNRGYITIWYVL